MQLDSMKPPPGSRKSPRRVGRGPGSGLGKTSGRGHKGRGARSGGNVHPGFEGGQMPLQRRLPKRGFFRRGRVAFQVVNIKDLAGFEPDSVVDEAALRERGLAKRRTPIKVLGEGKIDRKLTVRAHGFSASARRAIEAAGGACEVLARAEQAEAGAQ